MGKNTTKIGGKGMKKIKTKEKKWIKRMSRKIIPDSNDIVVRRCQEINVTITGKG
jgi:hypothetical protein